MPKIVLSDEERQKLEDAAQDLLDAEEALDTLERLGIDVTSSRQELERAKELRIGILREF